jgi:hypothetical protein
MNRKYYLVEISRCWYSISVVHWQKRRREGEPLDREVGLAIL